MKKEDMIAKALLNNSYYKALGEVFKAESGDTKMIFGKPFKYDGGKWVPNSGGGKKEDSPKKEGQPKAQDTKPQASTQVSPASTYDIKNYGGNTKKGKELQDMDNKGHDKLHEKQEEFKKGFEKELGNIKKGDVETAQDLIWEQDVGSATMDKLKIHPDSAGVGDLPRILELQTKLMADVLKKRGFTSAQIKEVFEL